jgi:hypothetical protein
VAEEPHEQRLQTELHAVAPRDIDLDVRQENILMRPRKRKAREDPDFLTYLAMELQEGNEQLEMLAAFSTALINARPPQPRPHRADLPSKPETWKQMVRHPLAAEFKAAATKEVKALGEMGTYEVMPMPDTKRRQILPLKWVFDYKFDSDGHLLKTKARICVRGDLQIMTSEEKRATTLAARTARAVLALVAAFGWNTRQLDAMNAFLNSELDEEVYTEMPEGFRRSGSCWRLSRALYGLRRAPRLWQLEVIRVLTKLGLKQVPEDPCLFVTDGIILLIYVDDIVIANSPHMQEQADELHQRLEKEWPLRDLGEASWFLGIRVLRDREQGKLWLCQDAYISSMAQRYHLEDSRRYSTPLTTEELRPYAGQATASQIKEYQQKIGSALYATVITRPDAARATAKLAEFMTNPGPRHLDAVDRVIGYLHHTRHLALTFRADAGPEVLGIASDASFGDNIDRKSTEGILCQLYGGPIEWRASKQRTVTTSTTEAELLAISEAGKSVFWWKRLFDAIRFDPEHAISIHCDNHQTVELLTKPEPQLKTRLRHVDIHHHWLRQEVQNGRIHVKWVPTTEMVADGLTKALPRQRHAEFIRMLGLEDLTSLLHQEDA